MTEEERAPRRLAESSGPTGDLLRSVLSEPRAGEPLPRFTQLQQKRLGRNRRQTAALVAVAAITLVVGGRSLRSSEAPVTVRAEPIPTRPMSAPSAPSARGEDRPALAHRPSPPLSTRDREVKGKQPSAVPSLASPPSAPSVPAPASLPTPAELHGSAKACAELARGGVVEEAIHCYEALANGAGVTAELALFEQARLAGKALRQPARALSLLDTYRQRFPSGSLRAEAMLASIEWSLAAGDSARARRGVDEALASGLLLERRAELERLRASLEGAAAH